MQYATSARGRFTEVAKNISATARRNYKHTEDETDELDKTTRSLLAGQAQWRSGFLTSDVPFLGRAFYVVGRLHDRDIQILSNPKLLLLFASELRIHFSATPDGSFHRRPIAAVRRMHSP